MPEPPGFLHGKWIDSFTPRATPARQRAPILRELDVLTPVLAFRDAYRLRRLS